MTIPAEVIAAVDETADYAFDNIVQMRREGRLNEMKQALLTRATFLKAEAALMLDEQWQAYGTEMFMDDGYRASRNRPADVSACLSCWETWDAAGLALYQALLHRAECVEIEAKAVQS